MSSWFAKSETKPVTKDTGKGNGNGWGIGAIFLVIFLFVILAFGIWGTCTDSGKSTFANIKNKFPILGSSNDLKSLDIIMFMNPDCPWCKKMINVLESAGQLNSITIVDITKQEGASMAQQFGADKQPVPSFISRKNKVGTVGYRDSVDKLIDALKIPGGQTISNTSGNQKSSEEVEMPVGIPPGQIDIEYIKSLQIVLFARDGCGWCQRAKESCTQAGAIDVIQIVDITTPEGQSMAGQMLPPGTSNVPAWVSMTNKKHVIGFKPFEQIIQALSNANVPNEMA